MLQALAAIGWAAATDSFGSTSDARAQRLYIPGNAGYLGRLAPRGTALTLTAGASAAHGQGALRVAARHGGRQYSNPTLVLQQGERARITLVNALDEPTIVHWHGLAVDTRNDGNGSILVAPGERFDYDFPVRNRGGMYWYHPHPHGRTAAQTYGGLFGVLMVEDDDERALRSALDLAVGITEIPLVLQDRRPGTAYAPSAADMIHGFLGEEMRVNGTRQPYVDVATRLYRFRILNACNARTLSLAFRTTSGASFPFTLIGNDGGLLASPVPCTQAFLATAERIDVLLDLRDAVIGDTLRLETLAFDPMHAEGVTATAATAPATASTAAPATTGTAVDHAAMGHAMPAATATTAPHNDAASWPEGAPRALLDLRVRSRVAYRRQVPQSLSTVSTTDPTNASERAFRLGFAKGRWRINDRVFEMGVTPIEVARGAAETWLIRNYHSSMPHAMHLHGFQFTVLARETSPEAIAALAVDAQGRLATDLGRKDTVLVWPGESVRIGIDFRHPYPDAQTYMFHCHNLEHEDGGMMLGVSVG